MEMISKQSWTHMNAARPSDGLLGAEYTINLLRHLAGSSKGLPIEQLLEDFSAISLASHSKTINTIAILEELEIVASTNIRGVRTISSKFASEECYSKIRHKTAELFTNSISADSRETCIRSNIAGTAIELDSFLVPGTANGSVLWLLEFGIVNRARIGERYWRVAADFADAFVRCVLLKNRQSHPNGMAISTLKGKVERNEELGREAEEWVLEFEKRRLSQHLLVDHIRRVSDENVSAGYDLVSFSGPTILTFDRFIEVKSHSNELRFFWSRNEIKKARDLAEKYVLILVDRRKMADADYKPKEISDPYTALFQTENSGWNYQPNSYEFNKIEE